MLPKIRRYREAWRAAIQREWHLWRARRLNRLAETRGREALELRDRSAQHEHRAKHFQLEEIRLREGL